MEERKSRVFKARKELRPYIEVVLRRRGFDVYVTFEEIDGICTNASGQQFHKAVIRAMCEKKTRERGLRPGTTFIHLSENPEKIMAETGCNCFIGPSTD